MVYKDETSPLVRKSRPSVLARDLVMKESKRSKNPSAKHRGLPENTWFTRTKLHRKSRPSLPARHLVMKESKRSKLPVQNIEGFQKIHGLQGRNFTVSEKKSTYFPSQTPSDERVEAVKNSQCKTSRASRKYMVYKDETSPLVRKSRPSVPARHLVMKESKRSKTPSAKQRGLPENTYGLQGQNFTVSEKKST